MDKSEKKSRKTKNRDLGNYLYQVRLLNHYTLMQASQAMNVHKSTLCRYEQGEIRRMSERMAEAVCMVYGISRTDLEQMRMPKEAAGTMSGEQKVRKKNHREDLMTEEEFLGIYRSLDDVSRRKLQYLAGIQLRLATP